MTQVRLSPLQLNELELINADAYGAAHCYALPGAGAHHATLFLAGFEGGDSLELLDSEATPVASVTVEDQLDTVEGSWIAGPVTTLQTPAPPLFPELRPAVGADELADTATLVMGGHAPDHAAGLVVIVDDGDAHALSQAVAHVRRSGADVRVLPAPAAEHVPAAGRTHLLEQLTNVLFASTVTTVDGVRVPRGDGMVILLTGLSGSGKSTIARALTQRLRAEGTQRVTLLDGDEVRTMLSSGLGFSRTDRELNVRRIGWVAALVSAHGGIAVCAPIAPYESMRAEMRQMADRVGRFVLVHVATPLEVCEARDRKGLYARARAGEIKEFTGISDPYEDPTDADIVLSSEAGTPESAADSIFEIIVATHPGEDPL